jgi:prophage antirepressor-like protein
MNNLTLSKDRRMPMRASVGNVPYSPAEIAFLFDSWRVCVVLRTSEPWWILKDMCGILGIANSRDRTDRLEEHEKDTVVLNDSIPDNPNKTVINDAGHFRSGGL